MEILISEIKDVIQKKQLLLEVCENLDQEFANIIKQRKRMTCNCWLKGMVRGERMRKRQSTFWKRKGKSYSEQSYNWQSSVIILFISF